MEPLLLGLMLLATVPMGGATSSSAAARAAVLPVPIALWPAGTVPGASGAAEDDTPAIYPYAAPAARSTGAAVLVIPGGGFAKLNLDVDGSEVAAWLNERGIAAYVLRYRLAPRYPKEGAILDASRAVQYLRAHSAEFKIAPSRIGVLGFGSGAELAAEAAYNHAVVGEAAAADAVARQGSVPNFLGLIYGAAVLGPNAAGGPPTFLVASSAKTDQQDASLDLWTRLRAARVPVDAHFFAKADASLGLAQRDRAVGKWPDTFYAWVSYRGYLTDAPRVAIKGMVYLDGRPLPSGYVVLTPQDGVGAGPIAARVINSTAGVPIGQFSVPAAQGPVAGRYRVEVHQNSTRWLSNSFTAALITDPAFGHSRNLSPSIDDQHVHAKVHPGDQADYVVEIKPGGDQAMTIEVFTTASPVPIAPTPAETPAAPNPGLAAYAEQLKYAPNPAPGVPDPILLWPQGAPGAVPDAGGVFTDEDKPAIYAYPAPAANNTGAAFLVLPGGAFTNRAIDQEGIQIARWLNRHGISGFVLRYRLRPNYNGQVSMLDAYRGMRYIRAHAAEYHVDVNRVGTIGFSAGSELEGDAFFNNVQDANAVAADPLDRLSARSNFNVLIYGGRNLLAPATAPPTFMFVTLEDGGGHLAPEINVLNGLRANGIPVEAHWYQDGPHGTSMSPGDPQLGQWPEMLLNWLEVQGFLAARYMPAR